MSKSRPGHKCQEDQVDAYSIEEELELSVDGTKLKELNDFKYQGS